MIGVAFQMEDKKLNLCKKCDLNSAQLTDIKIVV
jgi:hypothetical protein